MNDISLQELEELAKSVDPKDIKLFLHHAKIMNDKNAKMDDRARAAENVYAINLAHAKKNPKAQPLKALAQELSPELEVPAAQPAPAVAPVQIPFHEEFAQHHGGDPAKIQAAFSAMSPEHMATTKAWHQEQLANKMKKSIDSLYNLFEQLKQQL